MINLDLMVANFSLIYLCGMGSIFIINKKKLIFSLTYLDKEMNVCLLILLPPMLLL